MARSRNLKPGICKNKKLSKLSPHARILFRDLPMFADHEGRLIDDYETIHVEIFPFEHTVDVEAMLQELAEDHFIVRYKEQPLDGQDPLNSRFIWIVNFKKHQNPHKNEREKVSVFPSYNTETSIRYNDGTTLVNNESTHADSLNLIPDSLNPHTDSSDTDINKQIADIKDPNFKTEPEKFENSCPENTLELVDLAIQEYKTQYPHEIHAWIANFLHEVPFETFKQAIINASKSSNPDKTFRPNFQKKFPNAEAIKEIARTVIKTTQKPLDKFEKFAQKGESNDKR